MHPIRVMVIEMRGKDAIGPNHIRFKGLLSELNKNICYKII